jgi:hypothetical protein
MMVAFWRSLGDAGLDGQAARVHATVAPTAALRVSRIVIATT